VAQHQSQCSIFANHRGLRYLTFFLCSCCFRPTATRFSFRCWSTLINPFTDCFHWPKLPTLFRVQCLREKSVVFWFCKVVCLHTQGKVRHFGTLRCVIHFELIWCKNRSIFAKVVSKSLLPRFNAPQCIGLSIWVGYQGGGARGWCPELGHTLWQNDALRTRRQKGCV